MRFSLGTFCQRFFFHFDIAIDPPQHCNVGLIKIMMRSCVRRGGDGGGMGSTFKKAL